MNPYLLHLRHSVFVFLAPALAVAGALLAWSETYPQVMSSDDIADAVNATSAILAPVIAGFAAWDGLRDRRHGGAPLLEAAAQTPARIFLLQLLAGLTYTAVIFSVVVGVLHVRAWGYVLADPPRWLNLAVVLGILLVAATGGYFFAAVLKHWSAVVVASLPLVLIYGYTLLIPGVGLFQSLVPFGARAGGDFLVPNPPFFAGQLLFLMGVIAAMICVLLLWSRPGRLIGAVVAACALAGMVCGAGVINGQHHRWGDPVAHPETKLVSIASDRGNLTLEILPTYLPVKADLLGRWERVQNIFSETPARFSTLQQLSDTHPTEPASDGSLARIYLNPSSSMIATDSVTESLYDLYPKDCEAGFAMNLVEFWLAGDGADRFTNGLLDTDAESLSALQALSPKQSRDWMAAHYDKFVTCTLDMADLPTR